jgi:hypothetical protein
MKYFRTYGNAIQYKIVHPYGMTEFSYATLISFDTNYTVMGDWIPLTPLMEALL